MKKKTKRVKLAEPGKVGGTFASNQRPSPTMPVNPRTGSVEPAKTPFPAAYGAQASGPAGNVLPPDQTPLNTQAFGGGTKPQLQGVGNSGTQIFGGYFSEEYLATLRGRTAARKWDEMRRSESQISMLMNAVKNPIKAATWDIQRYKPEDASDKEIAVYEKHCELVKHILIERMDIAKFKTEALSMIDFGFALFEMIDEAVINHPKFGTFSGLKALAFRSQKTIENWQLEAKTGRLLGVNQYTYSDLGGNEFIPGEFLLVFSLNQEGDNYEGISALRAMFGAYFRKNLYLQLAAIGVERNAIGTPVGTIPKDKQHSDDVENFEKILQNYTSHEASYIRLVEGWKLEILKGEFDAAKIKELIVLENTEFANAIVANFLALGLHGSGSSLALGSNLLEFFTTGIQAYADTICGVINRVLIQRLIKMNFGEQAGYPTMVVTGISDKAGKEFAETIKLLVDGRAVDPDKPLKEYVRKRYSMPKPDPDSATPLPVVPAGAGQNYPKPNDPVVNPETGKQEPFSPSQLSEVQK